MATNYIERLNVPPPKQMEINKFLSSMLVLNFSPSPPLGNWVPSRVSAWCKGLVPGLLLTQAQSLISCCCKAPAWRKPRMDNYRGSCFLLIWVLFLFDPWRYYFPPSLAVYLKDICHISHSISRYFVVNGFYLIIKKN